MTQNRSDAKPQGRPSLRMLTLPEAADYAQTSVRTIRRRISEGHLQAYRMAGSRLMRIHPEDLDELFAPVPTAHAS